MDIGLLDVKYWAGTDESLAAYMAVARQILAGGKEAAVRAYGEGEDTETERQSRLLSKSGDLAIIKIAGPLNNTDSWINEYRGMTGYPEIRQALIQAAMDPDVSAILLDVNSGGGSVSGVFDTGNLIRKIDSTVKPVHSFSDGTVASAAYLLAASARTVSIGKMTEAGSVGVVSVHQEISKMLADAGVNVKVMRAGKYKALGNSFEPFSKLAQEETQAQLDHMYEVFVDYVAERRKVSAEAADKMAQGRIFIGDKAVEVGLVDSVTSFDALATKVQGGIDAKKAKSQFAPNSTQGTFVATQPLTDQAVAALALGGTASAGAAAAAPATELTAEQKAAKEAEDKKVADAAATAAAAVAAQAATPAANEGAVLTMLRTQLAESQEKVVSLSVELKGLKDGAEASKATHASMRAIAAESVATLRIALGTSGLDTAAMADAALLAEQAALRDQFNKKFKAGGVASVPVAESAPQGNSEDANAAVVRQQRLDAVRGAGK